MMPKEAGVNWGLVWYMSLNGGSTDYEVGVLDVKDSELTLKQNTQRTDVKTDNVALDLMAAKPIPGDPVDNYTYSIGGDCKLDMKESSVAGRPNYWVMRERDTCIGGDKSGMTMARGGSREILGLKVGAKLSGVNVVYFKNGKARKYTVAELQWAQDVQTGVPSDNVVVRGVLRAMESGASALTIGSSVLAVTATLTTILNF